jgi:hypothetical protein
MLDALVAGERDPQVLADLALGSLQGKVPLLTRALTGSFSEHDAFMVASMPRWARAAAIANPLRPRSRS